MNTSIIIPIYKQRFDKFEEISVDRVFKLFPKFNIVFICPESLNINYYLNRYNRCQHIRFENHFFYGIQGYNNLMLDIKLYKSFEFYDYILICQPDAYIFHNKIENFINQGYSIIGAPLPQIIISGIEKKQKIDFNQSKSFDKYTFYNGGLSLRNVHDCMSIISSNSKRIDEFLKKGWFEDSIFSILFKESNYKLPDYNSALSFAMELYPKQSVYNNNQNLPLGVHAWYRNDKRKMYDNLFWFRKIVKDNNSSPLTPYYWYLLSYFLILKKYVQKRLRF